MFYAFAPRTPLNIGRHNSALATFAKTRHQSGIPCQRRHLNTAIPDDWILFLEALYVWSYFIYLTGHVTAEDGRPLLDEDAWQLRGR